MKRTIARLQPLWQTMICLGFLTIILDLTGVVNPPSGIGWVLFVVVLVVIASVLMNIGPDADPRDPVQLAAPVRGTWLAMNSPGQRVPSHGTRVLGQLCAADLVQPQDHSGETDSSSTPRTWRASRPEEFRCYGAPIHAMADGVVVMVSDRQRDQRARSTWPAMLWFMTGEQILRALAGWRAVIGNRVVIKHDDETFSAYAHVQHRSARVQIGDRVQQSQVIAAVGNTGNSTEPHLHVQLMDRGRFTEAAGLPMVWSGIEMGGIDPAWQKYAKDPASSAQEGMPRNGQVFATTP